MHTDVTSTQAHGCYYMHVDIIYKHADTILGIQIKLSAYRCNL